MNRRPGSPRPRFRRARRAALLSGVLLVSACLLSAAKTNLPVDGYPASPQAADGRFRNPAPKPADGVAKTLGIVWNVLLNKPATTVPKAPVPVDALTRAATGGRAGPQPVPARAFDDADQAARRFLDHRPGVRRARLAGAMDGPEALPRAADRARRPAAAARRDPLARPLRPSRPRHHPAAGEDHRRVPHPARRRRPADRLGRGRRQGAAVRLVAGHDHRRRAVHRHAGAALFRTRPVRRQQDAVGVVGDRRRRDMRMPRTTARCACSSAATPATSTASRKSAGASGRST